MHYDKIKTRFHGCSKDKHNTVRSGDSGVDWMIVRGTVLDEREIITAWHRAGGDPFPYRCLHEHDCCGCLFWTAPHAVALNGRTLIRQHWARNV